MKTATLVKIANEIRKERGDAPVLTMNELFETLAESAGHCRTRKAAKAKILKALWGVESSPV